MRTDSVNLSQQALAQCKEEITKRYGEKYSRWFNYKTKTKGAQEAHEAIRPSYIERQSIEGTPAEKKTLRPDLEAHGRLADGLRRIGPHDHHHRHVGQFEPVRRIGRGGPFRRLPAPLLRIHGRRPGCRERRGAAAETDGRRPGASRQGSPPQRRLHLGPARPTRRRSSNASKSWASAVLRPTPRRSPRSSTAATSSNRTGTGRSATTHS